MINTPVFLAESLRRHLRRRGEFIVEWETYKRIYDNSGVPRPKKYWMKIFDYRSNNHTVYAWDACGNRVYYHEQLEKNRKKCIR